MAAQVIQFIIQITGTMFLARLLTPADFGLISMVAVVINFAQMFKDAGLSMATIQKDNISHEQISMLFWINVLVSIFIGLCVLVASPLVALFYDKPELTMVTAVLSVSFIITGLGIQHTALLNRNMRFGCLAFVQILAQSISFTTAIFLASNDWRYWALVGGSTASAFASISLTLFFCQWFPGRMQKGSGVRSMLNFGLYVTGFNFVNYFARNLDNILIGRYIGSGSLGLYSKAYQLFMLPMSQIRGPIASVAMPVLSKLRNEPQRYEKYYQRIIDVTATLTIPIAVYCIIEAEFIVFLTLGQQWMGAVSVFRILAFAGMIQPVAGTRGIVLLSSGFHKRYFYWGISNGFLCSISFFMGLSYGIEGIACAYAIMNYLILIPSLFYCFYGTPVTVPLFLKTLFSPLAAAGTAGIILMVLKWNLNQHSFFWDGLFLLLFASMYAGFSYCRKSMRETSSIILARLLNKFRNSSDN